MSSCNARRSSSANTDDAVLLRLDRIEQEMRRFVDLARLQVADWLSIEDAATVCGCHYDTIYRAIGRGELPAANIGTSEKKATYRVSRSDLNAWMEKSKGGKSLPPRSDLKAKVNRYLPGVA